MSEQPVKNETITDRHPLMTLGVLTVGTQLGTALIQKMGRQPLLLFSMGVVTGIYSYKHRKEILNEAQHLSEQSKKLFTKKHVSE